METVEIIVYIGIALVIGGLILSFVAHIDPGGIYSAVRGSISGGDNIKFQKVDEPTFATMSYQVWQQCGFGVQDKVVTLYVTGTGTLDRTALFTTYKKLNFCTTIQSGAEGC